MRVAIVGKDPIADAAAARLEKEKISITRLEPDAHLVEEALTKEPHELFIALDTRDETNLVLSALVKQLGMTKTVALVNDLGYRTQESNIRRAFHLDHLLFSDQLVVDKIEQQIFDQGIYSRSFLHGNVLLRTMQVPESSPFAGKTLSEIREMHRDILICLIHRPHKVVAASQERGQFLLGKGDDLIFAHGKDLLLPDDEITMIGSTDAILSASKHLSGHKSMPNAVCIVSDTAIGALLAARLKKHNIEVRLEEKHIRMQELAPDTLFVACHSDEEHNFVLGVQAKDHGVEKVIALLSDSETVAEAKLQKIIAVPQVPSSVADKLLEYALGGKISSVMSLYDARAEILQATISVDSELVGIPLSVLGPTLPKELLIGVIYTRGRIFIAQGAHILKPDDECLLILDPKQRSLVEKLV